jgi:hypothetical protein
MAKALLGHVGPDLRLVSEVARLRRKVKELEEELADVRATHDLERSLQIAEPRLPQPEPVLT